MRTSLKISEDKCFDVTSPSASPDYAKRDPSQLYEWSLDDFDIGKTLGRGQHGKVFLARERRSGYLVAIKRMKKMSIIRSNMDRQIMTEIEIQSHFRHPNVLRVFCHFTDVENIYIVLELAGYGEVYYMVCREGRFEEEKAAGFVGQVCCGLSALHAKKVIHRDIKPENLLIGHDCTLKLADFGWSTRALSGRRKTLCGTKDYIAPEMAAKKVYNEKIDVWMVGILTFEFVHGNPPFCEDDLAKQCEVIQRGQYTINEELSEHCKDFISKCLTMEHEKRPTIDEMLDHIWLKKHRHLNNPYIGSYYSAILKDAEAAAEIEEKAKELRMQREQFEESQAQMEAATKENEQCTTSDNPNDQTNSESSSTVKRPFDKTGLSSAIKAKRPSIPCDVPPRIHESEEDVTSDEDEFDRGFGCTENYIDSSQS
eukprot:GDKK01069672.1.p1 GENE.GDKK01069672.1~~GDKK01069672.1.p1  ORF type:complete len:426 (-),score=64.89 GDKK01069672.1:43-1320(-)